MTVTPEGFQTRIDTALKAFLRYNDYALAIFEDAVDIEKKREANRVRNEKQKLRNQQQSQRLRGMTYAPRVTSIPVYVNDVPCFSKCLHPMTEENSYLRPGRKSPECRTCRREQSRIQRKAATRNGAAEQTAVPGGLTDSREGLVV